GHQQQDGGQEGQAAEQQQGLQLDGPLLGAVRRGLAGDAGDVLAQGRAAQQQGAQQQPGATRANPPQAGEEGVVHQDCPACRTAWRRRPAKPERSCSGACGGRGGAANSCSLLTWPAVTPSTSQVPSTSTTTTRSRAPRA